MRRLSDWLPVVRRAGLSTLPGRLEAALQEMRAAIEGGQTVTDDEARDLGRAAGEAVWHIGQQTSNPRNRSFAPLQHMQTVEQLQAIIRGLGRGDAQRTSQSRNTTQDAVRRLFALVADTFVLAARGATGIDFTRRVRSGARVIRVLLTGFDPFNVANVQQPPRPRDWNPSGAAVMALDGQSVQVGRDVVAIEGVILPVSFDEFRAGLVERILQPLAAARGVDAVITVSEDPSLPPDQPVRFEQYSVGVHEENNRLGAIPAAGSAPLGPALIRTPAPLTAIASDVARHRRGEPAIPQPSIGTEVTLRFASTAEANRARTVLGQPSGTDSEVVVRDPTQLTQVQRNSGDPTRIRFEVAGQPFQATLVEGPGGNFLSNEVAFRTQRLLGSAASSPTSFHVHTQRGTAAGGAEVPQTDAGQRTAGQVRANVIATLRRTVQAVAERLPAPQP